MYGWQFMEALAASDEHGYERFTCMQPEYSLVQRHEEENMLPVATDQGDGVIPWSPLGGGFLTGKYERLDEVSAENRLVWMLEEGDRMPRQRFADENWAVLDVVRELAAEKDATPTQIALAWTLHKEIVDAPFIGPRTLDHLEENAGAIGVSLPDEEIARLEEPKYVSPAVR